MAGTFELTEKICWMPPGWFYDPVLRRMATFLPNHMTDLRSNLLDSLTEVNGGYCDLRNAGIEDLMSLRQAALNTQAAFAKEGPKSLVVPDAYDGLQLSLIEFIDMLDKAIAERRSAKQNL